VKTTFCIVKGRFDAVPSPSPTVSTLPTLLPTPKPTLVPSSLPTVIPSFPPTVSPSLPPTPSPTLTPTSGPTVNCYPGYYVNSNGACTICDVGKVSNTSLPPWPTECEYCDRGYVAKSQGLTRCDKCIPGKYSVLNDRSDCYDCEAGRYVPNSTDTAVVPSTPSLYEGCVVRINYDLVFLLVSTE
jgi:hypothetical protein